MMFYHLRQIRSEIEKMRNIVMAKPTWKLIFVLSSGAIVVFANAPAMAPANKLVSTSEVVPNC
jgi:hypothetical protein